MKKLHLFFAFLFLTLLANAQQIGMYSHFYFKPMVYNPAFTGFDDGINAMIISRNQWTGFKGAPQLNLFSLDGNINNKAGVGAQLISDRKGLTNRIGGNVSYSYWLKLNDDMRLSFGVSIGVIDQTTDFSKAAVENNTDPTLFATPERSTTFDANAGLAFKWKALNIGVAVPQLIGNKVNYNDNVDVRAFYMQARHYMGSIKYKIPVMEDKGISVVPVALVRYLPNVPLQYDGTLNIDWNDKIWVGATYKSDYAVGLNIGVRIQKLLTVGYSYDFITGSIAKYAGMSHEIMVSFRFGNRKREVPTVTPVVQQQPVTPPVVKEKQVMENKAYENRMDSLQQELKESQENLKKLSERLDQQLKDQELREQQTKDQLLKSQQEKPAEDNRNSEAIESNVNKTLVDSVWVITNKANEFKDDQNHEPEVGFYVIVGTFIYRDLAIAETQRFYENGYRLANWVYYEAKKYNYVFVERILIQDFALKRAKQLRLAGVKDVWIQELVK
ncbi:MAG TPA: PorP/SprF family type IX secretion system membrane protein [Bacteroidia bacterium]|nr:PorP/SprF family type IX secretion system membrane protein [Bacteroidia bacterium]